MEILESKNSLRQKMKSVLDHLHVKHRKEKSMVIAHTLFLTDIWKDSDIIFLYLSFNGEVATDIIVEKAVFENKVAAVPRINGKRMDFYRIKDLERGISVNRMGIREPDPCLPIIDPCQSDNSIIITPGLAFDNHRNRLGRGGGFYDRFISKVKQRQKHLPVVGVCFHEQLIDMVPVFSHDMKVDLIITDTGIIK